MIYVNMLEELPKLLVNTLEQLIQEKKLCQWNLQDNGNFVYINMRFGSHTTAAQNDYGDSHSIRLDLEGKVHQKEIEIYQG